MRSEAVDILLVEDDPAHAEMLRRDLLGWQVHNRLTRLADGQAALDYVLWEGPFSDTDRAPRPGLILLDLRLPKIGGLEVLKRIRSDRVISRIPVVIVTTSTSDSDLARAYSCQASGYLAKPVDCQRFTHLMESLGFWLEGGEYRCELAAGGEAY